jgi:hypothetical protein
MWVWAQRHWLVDEAASAATKIFNGAQCSACCTTYIIGATFQSIEFFHDREWNNYITSRK